MRRTCAAALNRCGRLVVCGAISGYDTASDETVGMSPPVVWNSSVAVFLVLDFLDEYAQGMVELQRWVKEGRIKVDQDVIEGLENAPDALVGLLAGKNVGKRMVKVSVMHGGSPFEPRASPVLIASCGCGLACVDRVAMYGCHRQARDGHRVPPARLRRIR